MVKGLNWMHAGSWEECSRVPSCAQSKALGYLERLVRMQPPPTDRASSEASLKAMLRGASPYTDCAADHSLTPCKLSAISLPDLGEGESFPTLASLLSEEDASTLHGMEQ
eukprot:4886274-Amphidinium_carterae.1